MKDVRYDGRADEVTITSQQFNEAGVSSAELKWNGPGDIQSVADAAAEHLSNEGRFTIVGEGDDDQTDDQPDEVGEDEQE